MGNLFGVLAILLLIVYLLLGVLAFVKNWKNNLTDKELFVRFMGYSVGGVFSYLYVLTLQKYEANPFLTNQTQVYMEFRKNGRSRKKKRTAKKRAKKSLPPKN